MKERPILFSAPMVRALLAGTKTQTRRVAKLAPEGSGALLRHCPYGVPGDQLWVREAWRSASAGDDDVAPRDLVRTRIMHNADLAEPLPPFVGKGRPSIHMPRWASRITLEVTGVRVERLQDISEADAWAEGCVPGTLDDNGDPFPAEEPLPGGGIRGWDCARDWYADLWDSINGDGAWDANPWVWVIGFRRLG